MGRGVISAAAWVLRRAVVATCGVRGGAVRATELAVARLRVVRRALVLRSAKLRWRRRRANTKHARLRLLLGRAAVGGLRRRRLRGASTQASQVVAPVAVARYRGGSRGRTARHRGRRSSLGVRHVDGADRAGLDGALPPLRRSRLCGVEVRPLLSIVQRVRQGLRQAVRLGERTGWRRRSRRHGVLAMRRSRRDRGMTRWRLGRW